jgi:ATP-dependent RNA helicase HelY
VAALASKRTYALVSAFRPTYNMAANLVRRYPPELAHHLLNLSFAQYRADSDIVRQEAELERIRAELTRMEERVECDLGDIDSYLELERRVNDASRVRPSAKIDIERALGKLGPGDVLAVPGQPAGRVAVIATGQRKSGLRIGVVTVGGKRVQLSSRDFPAPPRAVARIDLPQPHAPNNKTFTKQAADRLRKVQLRADGIVGVGPGTADSGRGARAMALAAELAAHPVAQCEDVGRHRRARARAVDLERRLKAQERAIRSRTESLARQFDRVLRVLEAWGYIDGWSLTEWGDRLAGIYHECDLLVAEAVRGGLFDGLSAPEVAALTSTLTYETRGPGPPPAPDLPPGPLRTRWSDLELIARQLHLAEHEAGLPETRAPDAGFATLAHDWTAGVELDELLADDELSGGDFVRNVKQLIDLVRQLGDVAENEDTRRACRDAAARLFRGVVAASSVVST